MLPREPYPEGGDCHDWCHGKAHIPHMGCRKNCAMARVMAFDAELVFAGNCLLIHCMAGRHRAAVIGVITRAVFAQESADQSARWIAGRRDIHSRREWDWSLDGGYHQANQLGQSVTAVGRVCGHNAESAPYRCGRGYAFVSPQTGGHLGRLKG